MLPHKYMFLYIRDRTGCEDLDTEANRLVKVIRDKEYRKSVLRRKARMEMEK